MRMKKIAVTAVFVFFVMMIFFVKNAYSLDCSSYQSDDAKSICEKVNDLAQKRDTLSSEIQYIDAQINLTTIQIQNTEQKITDTQKEIDTLGSRITGLDSSLNYLSKLLIDKIVEGYKQRSVSLLTILLDSANTDDLISQIKYLKTTQQNNQNLLVQVQETKLNFEEQKTLRVEKEKQLNDLTTSLADQKTQLESQQETKKNLLAATEEEYEQAQQELAGFSAFVTSAGGGETTFGNGSNGWYFTQRDPQWAGMTLPGSSSTVMLAGCAVSSVAMVCKSYGQNITPASIVSDPSKFIAGDLWNWAFSCSGKTTDWLGTSEDQVRSYVNNNSPVILRMQVGGGSVSGLHFIVAYAWDSGKNDFKIHDPYFGPDKYFSDRYNWGEVTTAIAIH